MIQLLPDRKSLRIYCFEAAGTAALLWGGISCVIFINETEWVTHILTTAGIRRAVTGFLFGTSGCLVVISKVGKVSGAHINPVVSIAFFLRKTLSFKDTCWYIIAQMAGSVLGCIPLFLWRLAGYGINIGATTPGPQGVAVAFWGEVLTTFCLITMVLFFTGKEKLRHLTPFMMPLLYCIMVYAEAPISGTSTNPARSFGPAVITGIYTSHWLFWVAPIAGTLLSVLLFLTEPFHMFRVRLAKLYHFRHNPHGTIANK